MGKFLALVAMVFGLMILMPLLSALLGAFAGWVVGWFFSVTILGFFESLGVTGLEMWQLGMSLGFIGGFFKSTVSSSK